VADSHWFILVAGVRKLEGDPGKLIDRFRSEHPRVMIQAVDAQAVYGQDHAIGAVYMAIEALERNIMMANRPEAEVLLRLTCTDQISKALSKSGLKISRPGCFIVFSKDAVALRKFGECLAQEFELDDSVLSPTSSKKARLIKELGLGATYDGKFLDLILERAAILVRN
jgi:tRNA threonylcarbamoyladenosine modification (KEOPS) complex Cgi121 subunit